MGERPLPAVARRAQALEQLVVKEGSILWVADARGDAPCARGMDAAPPGAAGPRQGFGLYRDGRRYLSSCRLTIQGHPLPAPAAVEANGYEASLAFPEVPGGWGGIAVLRTFLADGEALRQWITVETQMPWPTTVYVTLTFGAGDVDEWEGQDDWRPACAASLPSSSTDAALCFTHRDAAGQRRRATIAFDRAPCAVRRGEDAGLPQAALNPLVAVTFQLRPTLGEPATLALRILPEQVPCATIEDATTLAPPVTGRGAAAPARPWCDYSPASADLRQRQARWHLRGALYHTANPALDALLRRGAADLRLLLQPTGIGADLAPVAGLPWRNTFGARDALFAALLALPLNPEIATGVLRLLASHHGTRVDGWPTPDDARGDGDGFATPDVATLWVALLAETVEWTGDIDLLDELLPVAWQALAYGARYGENDRRGAGHQAAPPDTPLTTQAYVYLARRALARVLRRRAAGNDHAEVAGLELAAEDLRRRIERDFWLPREACYAPALDGTRHPVRAITSSAAYLLWARLASAPRARLLAERLLAPDLASGWGLRTRSTAEPDYRPLSAAHGAVWPHETAVAAIGLWRAGYPESGARLAYDLLSAAAAQIDSRLPERFAGDARAPGPAEAPRPCPVACAPYAPAAASPFGVLGALLGMEPNALTRRLVLRPILPPWLSVVSIQHLRVGAAYVNLEVRRTGEDGTCAVNAQVTSGELSVVVRPPVRTRG